MNWAPFISRLANILTNKVYFLNKYTEFGVNYALVEGCELDVEDQVNVPARLSTLLANMNMALRWSLANTDPVINGAIRPMIEEAPVSIECKVKEVKELGSHHMFIAEVLAVNADEKYFDKKGAFDISKCNLIAYANGGYYALGKKVGKFGYSVQKKKKKR